MIEPFQLATQLEQDEVAHHVGGDVGVRVLEGIPDPDLRSEMNDPVDAPSGKGSMHRLAIGDVERVEGKSRPPLQFRQAVSLQLDVVIAVQIVDADDLVAARQQSLGHMKADEAGNAGDHDLHPRTSVPSRTLLHPLRGRPATPKITSSALPGAGPIEP